MVASWISDEGICGLLFHLSRVPSRVSKSDSLKVIMLNRGY